MRILVADDTDIVRIYLAETLRAHGFEVEVAADGAQALKAASEQRFAALLLDLRMPGLFGDVVLDRLRADAGACSQQVPAIVMSSEMNPTTASALLARGFAAALGKPVPVQQLLDAVHRATDPGRAQTRSDPADPLSDMAAPVDLARLPLLDDERALIALGKPALVPGLRLLFRQELALRGTALMEATHNCAASRIRELIHQLLASCALCGATRMEAALKELRHAAIAGDWPRAQAAANRLTEVLAALDLVLPDA